MGKMGLRESYKYRIMMFVHKNEEDFQINTSESKTRMEAAIPDRKKFHSRTQAKYQG